MRGGHPRNNHFGDEDGNGRGGMRGGHPRTNHFGDENSNARGGMRGGYRGRAVQPRGRGGYRGSQPDGRPIRSEQTSSFHYQQQQ
jgi:hypothetical protein